MSMSRRNTISAKDHVLAAALAAGTTNKDAALEAGIGVRTAQRRMELPEFRALVSRYRDQRAAQVGDRLAALAAKAVETMEDLMSSETAAAVRCRAAQTVLAANRSYREDAEIEDRLRLLESHAAGPGEGTR
jgi:hypothetical protein